MATKLILASQSPRRRDLMKRMGLVFETIPRQYHEQLDEARDVEAVAKELSLGKALDVAHRHPDAYVIGSDTIVAVDNRQLEKPIDIDDARAMLVTLSGRESSVVSGVAVVNLSLGIQTVHAGTTRVYFKPDSDAVAKLREDYLATGDWCDKAGGYGIQSGASVLIDRIDGSYDTIVGLPTKTLTDMLGELGITAHAVPDHA